jgi:hypothetical protein
MSVLATIWTGIDAEVAETGFGFVTETFTVPTCAVVAVPVAVNSVGETKVVASATEPKFTTEPFMKPEPVSVTVKFPMTIKLGVTLLRTGIWLPRVIEALPDAEVSATLVAVTVIVLGFGRM